MIKTYEIRITIPLTLNADLERTEAWLVGFRGQPCRPGMSMLDWANGVSHARLVLEKAAVTFAELPFPPEASS
jgi:hypothetical protein